MASLHLHLDEGLELAERSSYDPSNDLCEGYEVFSRYLRQFEKVALELQFELLPVPLLLLSSFLFDPRFIVCCLCRCHFIDLACDRTGMGLLRLLLQMLMVLYDVHGVMFCTVIASCTTIHDCRADFARMFGGCGRVAR